MSVPTPHDEPPADTVDPAATAHGEPAPDPARVAAHVHVVRGDPDEVELAALVAGLVATVAPHDEPPEPTAAWTDRARTLPRRPAPAPGPDAWRWSLHP